MNVAANIDLVRRGYAAFTAGDMDTLRVLMAPDIVHSVPGSGPISGAHKGIDSVLALYGQLFTLSDGTMRVELDDALSNGDNQVIAIHRSSATRNGETLEMREALLFTIHDDRIAEIQDFFSDIEASDRFWA